MVTRVAKGTSSSKTSGNTLTLSNLTLSEGAVVVVAIGYDDAQGHPTSVKWGNRNLRSRIERNPGGYDIAHSVWSAGRIRKGDTRNLVVTWSGNITERTMVVTELKGARLVDMRNGNNDAVATTTPTTGVTSSASTNHSFALAFFVSEGPESDTVTSGTIDDAGSATSATVGQRKGTAGAPPVSNVTVQETFLELTSSEGSQGDLIAGTARKFISSIVLIEPKIVYLPYVSRTKDSGDVVMWCEDEGQSVGNGGTHLKWDGTGVNLNAVNDTEHKTAAIAEGLAETDDVIVFVDK